MLFCRNCGQQLEEDSKFYRHCGTKLIESQEAKIVYEGRVDNKSNSFNFYNFLLNFIKRHWFGVSLTIELIILFICIKHFLYNIIQSWGYVVWIVLGCLAFLSFMSLLIFIGNSEDRKKIKYLFNVLRGTIKKIFNKEEIEFLVLLFLGIIDLIAIYYSLLVSIDIIS